MKKTLALVLALCMVFALCACGGAPKAPAGEAAPASEAASADAIADEMTSSDGKYEIAFITDVGQLKDKSFNQGTFDGVKLYAAANGKSYKYYQPANGDQATDDDRYDAFKAAADGGAKIIVAAGFMQGTAIEKAANEYPEISFIFVDGWGMGLANVLGVAFKEAQCGYLAGYAVVKEGYTKLGFCGGGGGDNPACCRYGYGFMQGADAAAKELGTKIELNYSWNYGSSFSPSPELQAQAAGWYTNGTEVIFSCGGSMFQSVAAAAAAEDAKVVGVDVDQSFESDTVITSAMKGLADSVVWACGKVYEGKLAELNGEVSLGAAENAVGLPVDTWSLTKWSVDEYNTMLADIIAGKIAIDDSVLAEPASTDNTTVNIVK